MTPDPQNDPELQDLDRTLRSVRFEPRASLQPEVLGRLRRGERGVGEPPAGRWAWPAFAAAALTAAVVAALLVGGALSPRPALLLVDRCCFDLDGGGQADDGLQVTTDGEGGVSGLVIYEDEAGVRAFRAGDPLRYTRGGRPGVLLPLTRALVTIRDCCFDLDGEGPPDDGVVVLVHPPDQVRFAAIYETRRGPTAPPADTFLSPLR